MLNNFSITLNFTKNSKFSHEKNENVVHYASRVVCLFNFLNNDVHEMTRMTSESMMMELHGVRLHGDGGVLVD
jgi:hypothetical protein